METIALLGLFILGWIVVCAAAFFYTLNRESKRLPAIGWLVAGAFAVRIVPAFVFPRGASYEMWLFEQIGRLTLGGTNIYLSEFAIPYLPFTQFWAAIAAALTDAIGPSFVFWLKFPSIVCDVLLVALVYYVVRQTRAEATARWAALLYAVNPITILVAAYHGQFDTVTILCIMAAWYLFERRDDVRYGYILSGVILGVGILVKTWPFIFIPVAVLRLPKWSSKVAYGVAASVVPGIVVGLLELISPGTLAVIMERAVGVGAISGWWGYSSILNVLVESTGVGQAAYYFVTTTGQRLGLVAAIVTMVITRKQHALYSLVVSILMLFMVLPNLGLQGLSWLMPMAVLYGVLSLGGVTDVDAPALFDARLKPLFTAYTLGVFIHMLISYGGIHLGNGLDWLLPTDAVYPMIQLSSLAAWGPIVAWSLYEWRRNHHFRP